jgi:hypothetical protein
MKKNAMKKNGMNKLLGFLETLNEGGMRHFLYCLREDAVTVWVVLPNSRWEVDFIDDGSVEFERFTTSNGEVKDEAALKAALDLL